MAISARRGEGRDRSRGPGPLTPAVAAVVLLAGAFLPAVALVALKPPAAPDRAPAAPRPAARAASQPPPAAASAATVTAGETAQQRLYRAYVSAAVVDGAGLAAALADLQRCRSGRDECVARLDEAGRLVDAFQTDLSANPAPACLDRVDRMLRDGLGFQRTGLLLTRQALGAEAGVQVVQGLLLLLAGTWQEGLAVVAARQSRC